MYSLSGRIIIRRRMTQEKLISIEHNKYKNGIIITKEDKETSIEIDKNNNIIKIYEKSKNYLILFFLRKLSQLIYN